MNRSPTSLLGSFCIFVSLSLFLSANFGRADQQPDWSEGTSVPEGGNTNPYGLSKEVLKESVRAGKIHAQVYPVEITPLLPPYKPFERAMNDESENPLTQILHTLIGGMTGIRTLDQALAKLGLHHYPSEADSGVYSIPLPEEKLIPNRRVGFGLIETPKGAGFTISCAACHSSNLFGKTVLGLTNRFPRANDTFVLGKFGAHFVTPEMLTTYAGATEGEARLYESVRTHLTYVGAKSPVTLGLDTSLAQVALSLARRLPNSYADYDRETAEHPRAEKLSRFVADSKPAVWWNVKYKNRWLSDGSVISGNPIYTNLLWNEIGRGTDLHQLEAWFERNSNIVRDLTEMVFSIEAPRFTDFFPAKQIDLASAKRGETVYRQRCARCHGHYEKNWNLPNANQLPLIDQLKTWKVRYAEHTKVINVGTDPSRWQGMSSLEQLNSLSISKKNGIVIQAQEGYVPPPLVGIWARWPYFHNNSAPSLCAVLTRSKKRPLYYRAVEALDSNRDFDAECNGYPQNPKGQVREFYDANREGMHNTGHDEGIFLKNGKELLTRENKIDLIRFLQTL